MTRILTPVDLWYLFSFQRYIICITYGRLKLKFVHNKISLVKGSVEVPQSTDKTRKLS